MLLVALIHSLASQLFHVSMYADVNCTHQKPFTENQELSYFRSGRKLDQNYVFLLNYEKMYWLDF